MADRGANRAAANFDGARCPQGAIPLSCFVGDGSAAESLDVGQVNTRSDGGLRVSSVGMRMKGGWSTREIAEFAGTTLKAVRHYHRIGLLEEPERSANGYKRYGIKHLIRLMRIRRLVDLGVALSDICHHPGVARGRGADAPRPRRRTGREHRAPAADARGAGHDPSQSRPCRRSTRLREPRRRPDRP